LRSFESLCLPHNQPHKQLDDAIAGSGDSKASWQSWENSFFQPLGGKGAKLTDAERLRIDLSKMQLDKSKQDPVKAKKASSWQSWEDSLFGHSQAAVAARLLPPRHPHNAAARRQGKKSLVDTIADKSWVSKAEVDNVDTHQVPVMFYCRFMFRIDSSL
jgi:hypothetical protein